MTKVLLKENLSSFVLYNEKFKTCTQEIGLNRFGYPQTVILKHHNRYEFSLKNYYEKDYWEEYEIRDFIKLPKVSKEFEKIRYVFYPYMLFRYFEPSQINKEIFHFNYKENYMQNTSQIRIIYYSENRIDYRHLKTIEVNYETNSIELIK